ncbi:MAG TPA: hypothetical protein VMM79_00020 [Longimicrobiales bacterium]|nr:hypothetical protein [Longimicrobiales bacterium]
MAFGIRQIGAPLAIMVWQAAPMTVDDRASYRLSLGFGAGELASQQIASCAGDEYVQRAVKHRTIGVRADMVPATGPGRFTAFAGLRKYTGETQHGTVVVSSLEGEQDWFVGGALGLQTRYFGLEFGAARSPVDTLQESNGVFLGSIRIGNEDKLHLRADYNAPGVAHRVMGDGRLGLAWRQGRVRGWSGYAGLSACPLCSVFESDVGVFMETAIPISEQFDLMAHGFMASTAFGARTSFLGVGARIHF